MEQPSGDPRPIRIGHEERAAAVRALDTHLAEGRLDAEEYGERVATAHLARYRAELTPLFVDLPAPHPFPDGAPGARTAPPSWAPPNRSQYDRPERQRRGAEVVARRAFAAHPVLTSVAGFVLVTTLLPWIVLVLLAVLLLQNDARGWRYPGRSGTARWMDDYRMWHRGSM